MTIERRHVGKRLSGLVIHHASGTAYLAGQVADDPKADITGADAAGAGADRRAAGRSRHRQDEDPVGDDLPARHRRLRGDERGVGSVGRRRDRRRRARPSRRSSPPPSTSVEIQVVAALPGPGLSAPPCRTPTSAAKAVVAATSRRDVAPRRRQRRDDARHARDVRPVMVPVLRAGAVHSGARRRLARLGPGRPDVHRLRERRRGHRARPLPSGAGPRADRAGGQALARVELAHQRAGAAAREAAHRRDVRRARVLLQFRRRGQRGGAEARAPLRARPARRRRRSA